MIKQFLIGLMLILPSTGWAQQTTNAPTEIEGDDVDLELEAAIADAPSIRYNVDDLLLPSGRTIGEFYKEHPEAKVEDDARVQRLIDSNTGKRNNGN